jgi:hypothetical protein
MSSSSGARSAAKDLRFVRSPAQQTKSHITNVIRERSTKVRSEGSTVCSPPSKRHPTSQMSSWSGARSAQRRICGSLASQQTPSHITNVILERSTKCAAKDLRFARPQQTPSHITNVIREQAKCAAKDLQFARPPANAIPHHKCHPGAEHEVRSEGSAVRSPLSKRHPTSQMSSWSGARSAQRRICGSLASQQTPSHITNVIPERSTKCAAKDLRFARPQQTPSHITNVIREQAKCGAKDLQFARPPANAIPHHKCHPGAEHEVRSEAKCGAKRSAERSEVRSEGSAVCSPPATPSHITNVIREQAKCAAKDLQFACPTNAIRHHKCHPGAEHEVRSEGSAVDLALRMRLS